MELQQTRPETTDLEMSRSENPFSLGTSSRGGGVLVSHGPYAEELPVAGETVGRIRALFGDRFDIDPESQAVVDGRPVDDDTAVDTGQLLLFVRQSGEKGNYRLLPYGSYLRQLKR